MTDPVTIECSFARGMEPTQLYNNVTVVVDYFGNINVICYGAITAFSQ